MYLSVTLGSRAWNLFLPMRKLRCYQARLSFVVPGMEWDDLHKLIAREAQNEFTDSLYGVCRVADTEFLGNRIASAVCRALWKHGETVVIGPDEGCSQ